MLIFVMMANAASAPDLQGVVDVFNDSNVISALLQQQASKCISKRDEWGDLGDA
jgi:D-alanyl-D-alanine carboxypeptidase/D-alanyl-D-alanine-endopeptidase (penicillin-binding protein 4)